MTSIPSSSARLWSGAKAETLAIPAFTSGVSRTGSAYFGLPCTTRCPTTSSSAGDVTVRARVLLVLHQFVAQELLEVGADGVQLRNAVHRVAGEVKAIQVIHHGHVKRSGGSALFFISAHMEIVVTMTAIAQPMNEPWVPVISENHGFVGSEDGIEFAIGKTVRMFARRLQGHQVHDVNDADLKIGKVLAKKINRRQRLQCWHIAGASHHNVRLTVQIGAGPGPDT